VEKCQTISIILKQCFTDISAKPFLCSKFDLKATDDEMVAGQTDMSFDFILKYNRNTELNSFVLHLPVSQF
jgi:hypothetical protein